MNFILSLDQLPCDILFELMKVLDIRTINILSCVSRTFYEISQSSQLWFYIAYREWIKDIEQLFGDQTLSGCKTTNWKAYCAEKHLISQPASSKIHRSVPLSPLLPRFRHSVIAYPVINSSLAVILGGTGKTREIVFGDVSAIEIEPSLPWSFNTVLSKYLKKSDITGSKPTWTCEISGSRNLSWSPFEHIVGKDPNYISTRHTACCIDDIVWIFGGSTSIEMGVKSNQLIRFHPILKTWEDVKAEECKGNFPSPRSDHAGAVVGKKWYIFGGSDESVTPLNDLHCFDTESCTWDRISYTGAPPYPRSGHSMASIGSRIFVYGGAQWNGRSLTWEKESSDIFVYDTETNEWSKPLTAGIKPRVSTFGSMIPLGHHLLLLGGGQSQINMVSDKVYLYDTVACTWSYLKASGSPFTGKDCIGCTMVGADMLLAIGGYNREPLNNLQVIEFPWIAQLLKSNLYSHPTYKS